MLRDGILQARPHGGGREALQLNLAEGTKPDEDVGLKYPEANIRSVDFFEGHSLDRVTVAELATCGFVGRGENIVLQGFTGTGKTYLACALAKAAFARRVKLCFVRQPNLEDLWRENNGRPGGERKLIRNCRAFELLVIDEWLPYKLDTEFRSIPPELMKLRCGLEY